MTTRWLVVLVLLSLLLGPAREQGRPAGGRPLAQAARLAPEQAIAAAVNRLEATAGGYQLAHPRHTATFGPEGMAFQPRGGGPEAAWTWRLAAAGLPGVRLGPVRPANPAPGVVAYDRGTLVERYVARENGVEQQFEIARRPALGGADLTIDGIVRSGGRFVALGDGWQWRTESGAVRLGGVTASDARGRVLPATMVVTAGGTRITVDGAALATAAYPVLVDPEIGADDFRISHMGGDRSQYMGRDAAVAYNSADNEYLVVWQGYDDSGLLDPYGSQIFGQRVDGSTGLLLGPVVAVSHMGTGLFGSYPAVAYDSTFNRYLVVWDGWDPSLPGDWEIWGQMLNAATGAEVGADDFRISDMGPDADPAYMAYWPDVIHNPVQQQYLVVWTANDDTAPLAPAEFEIWAQRINASLGTEIGTDTRISSMGLDGNPNYEALYPAVAYNVSANEYLAVWSGEDGGALADEEFEIYGQRLDGTTGTEVGDDDFRLSNMGPDGDPAYDATAPGVAYNVAWNRYLIVWSGNDSGEHRQIWAQQVDATGGQVSGDTLVSWLDIPNPTRDSVYPAVAYSQGEDAYLVTWAGDGDAGGPADEVYEIFGQVLRGSDAAAIVPGSRLSDMGPDNSADYNAFEAAVAADGPGGDFMVVWHGDDDRPPLVNDELEVFGQRVDGASGGEMGDNDVRISSMGPDTATYDAQFPAVAYNTAHDQYLVVWAGVDDWSTLASDEVEIYGRVVDAATGELLWTYDHRLSDMGPDGTGYPYFAADPAVAYNSALDRYLVVWTGADDGAGLASGENEIWGQFVNGATGLEIGGDFRISHMGADGDPLYDAGWSAVAYNPTMNEYLVVYAGNDDNPSLAWDEFEIYGQVLGAVGNPIGTADQRISVMGTDGDPLSQAWAPAVACSPEANEYLVVWEGNDTAADLEIWGQRLDANSTLLAGPALRLSDMGPEGDTAYKATLPALAYSALHGEYLVLWQGNEAVLERGPGTPDLEIYGQRVDAATGAEEGSNDMRLSDVGIEGDPSLAAFAPAVAYDGLQDEYLVVWHVGPARTRRDLEDTAPEVYGQRLAGATGAEVGSNDMRLSEAGPGGDSHYFASSPAVAYSDRAHRFLVVWEGNDDTRGLTADDLEILGQLYGPVQTFLPLLVK